jgi:hypothetical protein
MSARDSGAAHYKNLNPEPIEVLAEWTDQGLPYELASALKYLTRIAFVSDDKATADIAKAKHFFDLYAERRGLPTPPQPVKVLDGAGTMKFRYHGIEREVVPSRFVTGRYGATNLIAFEVTRGGKESGVPKSYYTGDIQSL